MMNKEWYREEAQNILKHFNVEPSRGLTETKVLDYRQKYGQNILAEEEVRTTAQIFISQFKSPLIYVLMVALIIVLFLGDFLEAGIIFTIILLNAIIGAVQEGRAQNTLSALKKIVKSYVTVVRESEEKRIPDYELVPGDIILLKDGDIIGADARIIECNSLKINEAALTGESASVTKISEPINGLNVSTADQVNMIFRGTYVASGLGRAVVVETGIRTVVGKIARKLTTLHMDVPLKKNINNLSKLILISVLVLCVVILVSGMISGNSFFDLFKVVVAMSVAAIPEGLPVVVTLVLASGVWRMSKQNVLVKNLQAVEALGQAKVIVLDKTGTITKNQMMVEKIYTDGKFYTVTGVGYEPKGTLIYNNKIHPYKNDIGLDLLFKASSLTAIAEINQNKENGEWVLNYGDPTEAALLVLAQKFGYDRTELLKKYPTVFEIPFNNESKHHTIVNKIEHGHILFTAGGPEIVLKACHHIWENGKSRKITKEDFFILERSMAALTSEGYRVLALAINQKPPKEFDHKEIPELTFLGFVGIIDAIRPEVYGAVSSVRSVGIKVLMITGDHIDTATAIAKKVGIYKIGDKVLTGVEMNELSDQDLVSAVEGVTVYARVTPNDKLRVIEAYKKRKETIAMTGDGVNDALSLVAADLGVSMGKIGTEVAREASDLVLLDDNFGNIVSAAEEGRNIYNIIRKTVLYLLSTGLGEMLIIITALVLDLPLPLLAVQIIWLNLITGSILVAGLAFDDKDKNILKEKFVKPGKFFVDLMMGSRILLAAITMTIITIVLFLQNMNADIIKAYTISMTIMAILEWYNIFNIRSSKESVFSKKIYSNKYLLLGLTLVISLQLFAMYNPVMQKALNLTGLSLSEWGMLLIIGLIIVAVEEIRKFFYRAYSQKKSLAS